MSPILRYCERAGLPVPDAATVAQAERALAELADAASHARADSDLYRYRVPELSDDGSCSLFESLAAAPYDLSRILGGESAQTSRQLAALNAMVQRLSERTEAGWAGIYQARQLADGSRALIKLAYQGKPSRAEFPLTPEFAAHSNNSTVGLSGQAKLISRVADHVAAGGAYYKCDPAVQSEACLPLFDSAGTVVGIVDVEDSRASWFDGERLGWVIGLCLMAVEYLPAGAD
ncbi:GAF domain-containing protein [Parachitinimonas caeni]|uniref:GAF domain-containing protein n=1 Tax=Parachitinimonas caeni TaxID=3031301 RepID=A0ABT7DZJ4_9NEIS|nr:GAF domain-containing protein [Parachitinimonas caeni]MDK2125414.1 hypothetical protein [Parachitinimonas caeni]